MTMFLGIDFGTSGVRLIVIDNNEQIKAQFFGLYQHVSSHYDPSSDTQNPMIWWRLLLVLLEKLKRKINLKDIKALSIDGTSGTIIVADEQGKPLHDALMYHNAQAIIEADSIKKSAPEDFTFATAESGLAKILYLEKLKPNQSVRYFNQADWIYFQLTKHLYISDINNVLKMGYDVIEGKWPDWFDKLNLDTDKLPTVYQTGEIIDCESTKLQKLGFSVDINVVSGSTDSTAAIYASKASNPGDAITSLGSTLVTKVVSTIPINQRQSGVYSQPFGKNWLVGGASNTGGQVLKHYFSLSEIEDFTRQINPEHLLNLDYYPLVTKGERFPENNPEKEPLLKPVPDIKHEFFQAMLEGIADIEAKAYQKLIQLGAPEIKQVISMGGGAVNYPWQLIRENKIGVPCVKAQQTEAAYGVALLAKQAFNE